jgi:hypothetical protein
MWQQLAMAAAKSIQDERNRQNDIASNVITQKYSPWTKQSADFSSIAKNNTIGNLMAGYGSGLLQDRMDQMWEAQRPRTEAEKKAIQDKADGEFYEKLSKDPSSVGASPISGGNSSFAAMAKAQPSRAPAGREPAINPNGNTLSPGFSFEDVAKPSYQDPTPFMLQQNPNQGMNKWDMLSQLPLIQGTKEPSKPQWLGTNDSVWGRR